ncbi:MAG: TnpV protein [Acutalibacteraceae bacterium]
MQDKNELTYRQVSDYLIPNLTLPPEEANIQLGKWGILHKDYLQKHKPVVFATLLAQGKLWQYLADIDSQAREMFDLLVEQMKEREGVTERLKEENQMEWICRMESIEERARDIVNHELICT